MRGAVIALITLPALCSAGCALSTGESAETRDDEETGTAQDAAIQFIDPVKFVSTWKSRKFPAPKGSTARAAVNIRWDRPGACKLQTVDIILTKVGMLLDSTIGEQACATDAKVHAFTWPGLEEGTYRIDIGSINDNPNCQGIGSMTVGVTP